MEHKPKRQTRARIRNAALLLFNRFGEPNVTLSAIAADVGISHGNLHYHYPSKDRIVDELVQDFLVEIEATFALPAGRTVEADDLWLFLHLTFETILRHRFLYRDLIELLSRHRLIEKQIRRVIEEQTRTAEALLAGLAATGALVVDAAEMRALAERMAFVATWWLCHAFVLNPRAEPDGDTLARGVARCLSLAAPYLREEERAHFDKLSGHYIKKGGNKNDGEENKVEAVRR